MPSVDQLAQSLSGILDGMLNAVPDPATQLMLLEEIQEDLENRIEILDELLTGEAYEEDKEDEDEDEDEKEDGVLDVGTAKEADEEVDITSVLEETPEDPETLDKECGKDGVLRDLSDRDTPPQD